MFFNLIFGGLLLFGALQLWSKTGDYKELSKAFALLLAACSLFFLIPVFVSFAIKGIVLVVVVLAVFFLLKLIV